MLFEVREKFHLSPNFLEQYKGKEPGWGPLGFVTYLRTYSRLKDDGTNEKFWETIKRVVEGIYTVQLNHCKSLRLSWNQYKAQKSAQEMYRCMFEFKFLPAGRGLYNMGTNLINERGSMFLYNCAMVSTENISYDFSDPFVFMMNASMTGCGVGFDTVGAGKIMIKEPKIGDYTFVTEDSREGWCETLRVVLDAYSGKQKMPKEINYSKIRPCGAPIKTSGGVCPGAGPLKKCIEEVKFILDKKIDQDIDSGTIVDLMNVIGKAVVSGGKRRTAQIAIGNHGDKGFLELKDPEKYPKELEDWRWASNNSISIEEGVDYAPIVEQFKKTGEPGLIYLEKLRNYGRLKDPFRGDDLEICGVNPCGEIGLPSYGLCNLVEVFPSNHEAYEEFKRTLKYSYLYAKSTSLIPTEDERVNQVILRQRRLGISQSGITQAIEKHGMRNYLNWCDEGYKYLVELDKIYSNWLCVTQSIKLSTVKPSGTTSLLPGVTPGIHFPHSEYFIRRIIIEDTATKLIKALQKAGYPNEKSLYGDNSTVFEFPIKSENFFRSKKTVSIWEQLELGAKLQELWADNSISQTITIRDEEVILLKEALEMYEDRRKTISFLPLNKKIYKQMPYEEIIEEEYNERISKIKPLKISLSNNIHEEGDKYCDGDNCIL